MDADCPRARWLVLFGGDLRSALDGSRLKRDGKNELRFTVANVFSNKHVIVSIP